VFDENRLRAVYSNIKRRIKMKFSIGYNQDIKLLDLLDVYKDNIESLYFPIPRQYLGSGRSTPQKNSYLNEIPEVIKKCNSLKIKSQLLLNATCEGESGLEKKVFSKIIDYVKKLKSLGLKSVVVTNPVYIYEIKEQIKGIEIESSVNCYVKTVEHALYLKDLGVDTLVIDRDINRNVSLIKEIKDKTGLKIKILLNEGCLRNCPFRKMHFNFIAHEKSKFKAEMISEVFFEKWCVKIFSHNPEKIFSVPFIPPDALKYYIQFVDYFKISSRDSSTSMIEFRLKAYINQNFNGNLLSLLDCSGLFPYFRYIDSRVLNKGSFFKKMLDCTDNCNECNYCNKLVNKAVITDSYFLDQTHPIRIKEGEKVVKICGKAIESNPKEIDAYSLLGSYYEKTKNSDKALKVYKKALKIFPNAGFICLGLGRSHFHLKKYEEAIKNIKKAIGLNYKEFNIYFLLGSCYERIGQYKEAIEELKVEEKVNPEDARINFLLTKCYRKIGQIEQSNKEEKKGFLKFKKSKQMFHLTGSGSRN
jgi:tetratricopeptide (TPR) repeat protein